MTLAIVAVPSLAYELGHWLGATLHYVGVVAGLLLLSRCLKSLIIR